VVTAGYGDLYNGPGDTLDFTDTYDGTSSASPVVPGAVACCVGMWNAYGWDVSLLAPTLLRNILVWTGTPQNPSPYGHIGPRPDLRAAEARMLEEEIEWADATAPPVENYALRANTPNPFRGHTTIRYELPGPVTVSLVVYDVSGRRVATLIDSERKGPRPVQRALGRA
jgi:hypothetical protein